MSKNKYAAPEAAPSVVVGDADPAKVESSTALASETLLQSVEPAQTLEIGPPDVPPMLPEAPVFFGTPVPMVGGLAGFQELANEADPVGSAAAALAHVVNTDLVRLPPQGVAPRQIAYLVDGVNDEKPVDVAAWLRAELAKK